MGCWNLTGPPTTRQRCFWPTHALHVFKEEHPGWAWLSARSRQLAADGLMGPRVSRRQSRFSRRHLALASAINACHLPTMPTSDTRVARRSAWPRQVRQPANAASTIAPWKASGFHDTERLPPTSNPPRALHSRQAALHGTRSRRLFARSYLPELDPRPLLQPQPERLLWIWRRLLTFATTAKPGHTKRTTAPHLHCGRCCRSKHSAWCPKHQPHRPNSSESACTLRCRGELRILRVPRCHQSACPGARTPEGDVLIKAPASEGPHERDQPLQNAWGTFHCQEAAARLTHSNRRTAYDRSATTGTNTPFSRGAAASLDGLGNYGLAASQTVSSVAARSHLPRLAAPLTASTN